MFELDDSEPNPFKALAKGYNQPPYEGYVLSTTYITMRDGIKIAATICLPKGLNSDMKIPALLYQTRYWRATELRIPFRWIFDQTIAYIPTPEIFTSRGYAIVYTDVRGTGASQGSRPYPWAEDEIKDGSDVIDWIISQPWSDGNVVTNGISYTGTTAELLMVNNHPALKASMPGHGLWDAYLDVAMPGGVYDHTFMQLWSFFGNNLDNNDPSMFKVVLPLEWLMVKGVKPVGSDKDLNELKEAIQQHSSNQYVFDLTEDKEFSDDKLPDGTGIEACSVYPRKDEIEASNVPILSWCSWLDSGYCDANIHRFLNLNNPMIVIMGDWNHGARFSANQFFPDRPSVIPSPNERVNAWVDFFNICVKGNGIQGKTLYYYTMVEEKWKKTHAWPPKGHVMKKWYLAENNSLSTNNPEAELGADEYKINYTCTSGRLNRWWTLLAQPIDYSDRAKVEKKMLTYTSSPLEEDMEITGNPIITLFLSSTHEDGAIFVYLDEVDENGNITYITDGQFRVIHRKLSNENPPYKMCMPYHSFKKKDAQPLIPGEIAEITFGLHVTSVLIRKGHSIRMAIAGHDKDTFSRYPAEGRPTISINRNKEYPSFIELPVIKKN
ncbi:MAG: CocE/NonD family hydrolase [Promethearchaeota archaeon]|nr:MAG: CocE/NonD family hydrolase [Candidatus Lokiarchaeota archaeon]